MNKNLHLALSTVVLGTVSQLTSAGDTPMGLSARVGADFCLNRSEVKLSNNNTYRSPAISFSGGIDWTGGEIGSELGEPGQKSTWGASIDYYGNGNRYNIPLLASFRGKMDQFEYSAGLGVGFGRIYDTPTKAFKGFTGIAFQLSGRYYFQKTSENPLFLEARYYGSSKSELNGIAVQLGISF